MLTANLKSRCTRLCDGLTAIRGTLICSLVLVFLDVVVGGTYLVSGLVCPIWFLVSAVRVIVCGPSLGVAAARMLIPLATGLLVVANSSVQTTIATDNAARVIQACERYREANGAYPERLSDLVPGYLSSVPMAKYCCFLGEFQYFGPPDGQQSHLLVWCQVPPFGRRVYNFERGTWRYLD